MHFYENSPITTGAIDYYANRLYNDSVVSRGVKKFFSPPPTQFLKPWSYQVRGFALRRSRERLAFTTRLTKRMVSSLLYLS